MKKSNFTAIGMLIMLLMVAKSFAGIRATAFPIESNITTGQQITIPVEVSISALPGKMGSFTASLTWDPTVLQFISYTPGDAQGFSHPVVNTENTKDGKLVFAAANPSGGEGKIQLLYIAFKVVGIQGTAPALDLQFSAMAAAHTFENLLPYLEIETAVENKFKIQQLPKKFALFQNYPNPFNPSTLIRYQLPKEEMVSISVFNSLGQEIKPLVKESKVAGNYSILWNGTNLSGQNVPAGIYICKMIAGDFIGISKMLLIR